MAWNMVMFQAWNMIIVQARKNIPYTRVVSYTWNFTKSKKSGKWSSKDRQDKPPSAFWSELCSAHFMYSRPRSTFHIFEIISKLFFQLGKMMSIGPMAPSGPIGVLRAP